jgi:putative ABC transport system substrate-binding protein
MYRRAAYFVDRIFKGEKPADLPVEQAAKFEMVVNFRTAKAIGWPSRIRSLHLPTR